MQESQAWVHRPWHLRHDLPSRLPRAIARHKLDKNHLVRNCDLHPLVPTNQEICDVLDLLAMNLTETVKGSAKADRKARLLGNATENVIAIVTATDHLQTNVTAGLYQADDLQNVMCRHQQETAEATSGIRNAIVMPPTGRTITSKRKGFVAKILGTGSSSITTTSIIGIRHRRKIAV